MNPLLVPMQRVESSQIYAIGHDEQTKTLVVQFLRADYPGDMYTYENVSKEDFAALLGASSVGSHFNTHFKKQPLKHPFKKIL